jgi:hypothetical protein
MAPVTGYPPEPWDLRGEALLTFWLTGRTPVGRGVVCTAFVDYHPGGLLPYHELLVSTPARWGVTIPLIWVDSAASRAGGRELWGIPKEMAAFPDPYTAEGIASARFTRPRRGLPVAAVGRTVQPWQGEVVRAGLKASATVTPVRAAWEFERTGPLAFLRHRRPLLSLAVRDLRMRFGPRR